MLYHAVYTGTEAQAQAQIVVIDDRGIPTATLDLPTDVDSAEPEALEGYLRDAGWTPRAQWSETDQGWRVPVERDTE